MKYEIRELKVTEILDQAIKLIQDNYKLLFGILLAVLVPCALAQQFLTLSVVGSLPTPGQEVPMPAGGISIGMLIALMVVNLALAFVVIPITNAALVHAIAKRYLMQSTSVGQALGFAAQRVVPLAGTWMLVGLTVLLGLLLCVVPGILFGLWFAMATQVVVLEGLSGVAAMKRSKQLMTGNIGKLFLLGLVVGAINIAAASGAGFVPQPHVRAVLTAFVQGLETLFGSATGVLFYFSARCKHENFDLTLLADTVATNDGDVVREPGLE